jgi:ElaB/YqjD/DUF883 family membrane-anchored ribosome-binding protein
MEFEMTDQSMPGGTETRTNGAADTAATIQDAVTKLGAQAADVGGQVYQKAVDAGKYAGRQVEEQPWAAAAAIGMVGLLLGIMLGRASVPAPRTARDYVDDYLPRRLRRG